MNVPNLPAQTTSLSLSLGRFVFSDTWFVSIVLMTTSSAIPSRSERCAARMLVQDTLLAGADSGNNVSAAPSAASGPRQSSKWHGWGA